MYSTHFQAGRQITKNVMLQKKKSDPEDQGWQKTATQNFVIRRGTVPGNLWDYTTNFFRGIYYSVKGTFLGLK